MISFDEWASEIAKSGEMIPHSIRDFAAYLRREPHILELRREQHRRYRERKRIGKSVVRAYNDRGVPARLVGTTVIVDEEETSCSP